jgi:Mce-associated membrane protein
VTGRVKILIGMLAVTALALGACVAIMYANLRWIREGELAGREALGTARTVAPDMLSYDHETIEADLARSRSHATGELTGHLTQLARTLVPEAKRERTVRQASVAAAAVESAEPDRVEVVLFVNIRTTRIGPGDTQPRQRVTRDRARFVMVRSADRWLVSELSTLLGSVPSE